MIETLFGLAPQINATQRRKPKSRAIKFLPAGSPNALAMRLGSGSCDAAPESPTTIAYFDWLRGPELRPIRGGFLGAERLRPSPLAPTPRTSPGIEPSSHGSQSPAPKQEPANQPARNRRSGPRRDVGLELLGL